MEKNVVRKEELLSSLNREQLEAVITMGRPLLVLSGAGTGKTKVLTTRIAYIIEQGFAFPEQILAVTFSNFAARQMKERLNLLIPVVKNTWIGTFHSICAKILRIHADKIGLNPDFTILDTDDQSKIIKQILKELNLDAKMVNSFLSKISRFKDKGYLYNNPRIDLKSVEAQIYKIYQERIRSYDSVDFGDILLYVIEIFKNNPDVLDFYRKKFKHILVDEYQDTNMSQYLWLRMLAPNGDGICCVGDDDQAIYSWRGAEVDHILRFEHDFENALVIRLEQNYRSFGHILGAAAGLISNNKLRLGKTIWTTSNEGEMVQVVRIYNGLEEARFVSKTINTLLSRGIDFYQIAILVRAGFQTREFEEQFISFGIPYRVVGGLKFYERMEIKDIVAYMRLVYQSNDSMACERIINSPKRGIGASAVKKFYDYAIFNKTSLYEAAKILKDTPELRPSLRKSVNQFVDLIESFKQRKVPPSELANIILKETGYLEQLKKENTLESMARIENVKELIIALEGFETLSSFIEHVSLVMDSAIGKTENVVSIMTIHGAKGLEFDAIFLAGWEEGLFPHNLSLHEGNIEEERRLAYVALTRAKQLAIITYATYRKVYNQWQSNVPSRFLYELPKEHTRFQQPLTKLRHV